MTIFLNGLALMAMKISVLVAAMALSDFLLRLTFDGGESRVAVALDLENRLARSELDGLDGEEFRQLHRGAWAV